MSYVSIQSRSKAALVASGFLLAMPLLAHAPLAVAQDSPVDKINAEAERSDIKVIPLRGDVAMIEGSGGNIGVLVTPSEKFMVDAGIAVSKDRLSRALATLGPAAVKHVVDTHWHWDHADGNAWLHDAGAQIIAHPRTAIYLARTERVDDWRHSFDASPPSGRATKLVPTHKRYLMAGEQIDIEAIPPAHTDGDLFVRFRNADVLFVGDTYWNGMYPFIDNEHGGSIDGMIRAADLSLRMAGDKTIIVPGHGPAATRADLEAYRTMLQTVRGNVARLKGEGRSLEAVIAAKPTAAYDATWGGSLIDPAFFTRLVYNGL